MVIVRKPVVKLYRMKLLEQHVCKEEEVFTDKPLFHQGSESILDREDSKPPEIKEEHGELSTSLEGEHLKVKQETDIFLLTPTYEKRLPQQHACKEEESFANQQLFNQESNSCLNSNNSKLPDVKEEHEELSCTSQEGKQFVLKDETNTSLFNATHEKSANSQDQSLYLILDEPESGIKEYPPSYILVENLVVSEPNGDHHLLSNNSQVTKRGDQEGHKQADSESTRNAEPKPEKSESHRNDGYCPNLSEHHCNISTELAQQIVCKEEKEDITDQQLFNQERNSCLDQEDSERSEIKEEQDELCSSQEGEQVVLKPATYIFILTPTCEKSEHSPDQTLHCDSGVKPFSCNTCGKTYWNSSGLKIHIRTHTGERPFLCEVCGKTFTSKNGVNVHRRIHTDEKPYSCKICGKGYTQMSALKSHIRTHMDEKPYSCNTCGKTFSYLAGLDAHIRIHTGERPFACDICGKTFIDKSKVKAHRKIHTGDKPFACDICGKTFIDKAKVKAHRRIHTGDKPFACDICGKTFFEKSKVNVHRSIHTGEKPHSCKTCGKGYTQLFALKTHIRTHTGERPFSCDICGKTFINKAGVEAHRRIHTGDKPFACDICGKKFAKKFALHIHRRIHTGEKPYSCKTCGKEFKQSSALKCHLRTHTGEKPYSCTICEKRFSNPSGLKVHLKTHTADKPVLVPMRKDQKIGIDGS